MIGPGFRFHPGEIVNKGSISNTFEENMSVKEKLAGFKSKIGKALFDIAESIPFSAFKPSKDIWPAVLAVSVVSPGCVLQETITLEDSKNNKTEIVRIRPGKKRKKGEGRSEENIEDENTDEEKKEKDTIIRHTESEAHLGEAYFQKALAHSMGNTSEKQGGAKSSFEMHGDAIDFGKDFLELADHVRLIEDVFSSLTKNDMREEYAIVAKKGKDGSYHVKAEDEADEEKEIEGMFNNNQLVITGHKAYEDVLTISLSEVGFEGIINIQIPKVEGQPARIELIDNLDLPSYLGHKNSFQDKFGYEQKNAHVFIIDPTDGYCEQIGHIKETEQGRKVEKDYKINLEEGTKNITSVSLNKRRKDTYELSAEKLAGYMLKINQALRSIEKDLSI